MKNTPLLILAATLLCGPSHAADPPTDELPKFGNPPDYETLWKKTPEAEREAAKKKSGEADKEAWEALRAGDDLKAIKSFNQAWTLWPENHSALWGMGIAVLEQTMKSAEGEPEATLKSFDEAVGLVEEARELTTPKPPMLTDLALIHASRGAYRNHIKKPGADEDFTAAEGFLKFAETIQGPHPQIEVTRETLERYRGNPKKADAHAKKAQELIDAEIAAAEKESEERKKKKKEGEE